MDDIRSLRPRLPDAGSSVPTQRFTRSVLTTLLTAAISALAASVAAASTSPLQASQCERISTGPGPDDIAVQTGETPRLLISSHDRRRFVRPGDIYAYTPSAREMVVLKRTGEPEGFRLRPHGIDLVQRQGRWWLYVVSHDRELISDQHSLMIYEVDGDTLRFHKQLLSPLLSAPNDVAVADNGDIYVTNERRDGASIIEWLLLQQKATVAMYRAGQGWQLAAEGLAIANGIVIDGNTVWVTQTLGEGMVRYSRQADGKLAQATQLTSLSLLDGLSESRPGYLLATSYPSLIGLGLHWQRQRSRARTVVHEVNTQSGSHRIVFSDPGTGINAVSSARRMGDRLYLGQLFDPYLLNCPWPGSNGNPADSRDDKPAAGN